MVQKTLTRQKRDHNRSVIFHFLKAYPEYSTQPVQSMFKAELSLAKRKLQSLNNAQMRIAFGSFLEKHFGPNAKANWEKYLVQ